MIWLTIDIEKITDMNFNVLWKKEPVLDYEKVVDDFLSIKKDHHATAFILGTFAKKYPQIVKKLYKNGVEISCHGMYHNLVYKEGFKEWSKRVTEAKDILENLISERVLGYRSPSWSMPFEKRYYEELARVGFEYSSSYFPMKNYMYGNSIDRKKSFKIYTKFGTIEERPILKYTIPFSGGVYLRVLPLSVLKMLFKKSKDSILYIHPYELLEDNLLKRFKEYADLNLDYFLAFYSFGSTQKKIKTVLRYE